MQANVSISMLHAEAIHGPSQNNSKIFQHYGNGKCSKLQHKCQLFYEFSIENAEITENSPWKTMILIEKWPFILRFEVRAQHVHHPRGRRCSPLEPELHLRRCERTTFLKSWSFVLYLSDPI